MFNDPVLLFPPLCLYLPPVNYTHACLQPTLIFFFCSNIFRHNVEGSVIYGGLGVLVYAFLLFIIFLKFCGYSMVYILGNGIENKETESDI